MAYFAEMYIFLIRSAPVDVGSKRAGAIFPQIEKVERDPTSATATCSAVQAVFVGKLVVHFYNLSIEMLEVIRD